jgi:hypothetical protein
VAPEVIRSLYGSENDSDNVSTYHIADSKAEAIRSAMSALQAIREPEPEPEPEDNEALASATPSYQGGEFPAHEPEPQHEPEPEAKTTLADAMAAGHRTLGETLRGGAPGTHNMASHIAAAERSNLRRSIGLNDRFLMIRDMFDGDATAFDSAIARLDTFTDLDEAVIWMRDNYDWNAESKGVTLLIGLLERKLGA